MKPWVVAAVSLVACGSSKDTHEVTETHVRGTGSAPERDDKPAPATGREDKPPPTADETTLSAAAGKIASGAAWKPSVLQVVAIAGPPNIIVPPNLYWFAAGKGSCTIFAMRPRDEFVSATDLSTVGDAAEDYKPCVAAVNKRAKLPDLVEPRKLDLDKPAREFLAAWRDGHFQAIVDGAHPELREDMNADDVVHLAKLFEPIVGKLVEPGSAFSYDVKDFSYVVSGPVKFDKATLTFTLQFRIVDNQPRLRNFDLKLPKDLQTKPDIAEGEKLAHRALETVLAGGHLSDVLPSASVALVSDVRKKPDLVKGFDKLARDFGSVRSITLREQSDCNNQRCIKYDVVGSKRRGSAEVAVEFIISRWEVAGIDLRPS